MEKLTDENKRNRDNEIIDYISLEQIMICGIKNCICNITLETKKRNKIKFKSGTGFFCNISCKNIKIFITNNHVLDQKFLDSSKKLIYYNCDNEKKEINLELNRYKYTDKDLDFTIIEILKEDNISNFLEIDENINLKEYKNKQIFSIQFPGKKKLQYSHGKIYGKNDNYFIYSIGTLQGSSGSPIILMENRKLIGLHKGRYIINKNKINLGIPINLIINKIDYIKCTYNIDKENVGKEIQLINNKYYDYESKNFINNNEIENKIIILINGEIKSNILKYKFNDEGKYNIYFLQKNILNNISGMFYECNCLEKIDLSSFRSNDITNISSLFSKCSSLKEINFSSFKIDKVRNMSWMFNECSSLKSINLLSFKDNKVKYISGMFNGCSSLKEINLSLLKSDKVRNMSGMFEGCSSLKEINLSLFKTDKVNNMLNIFKGIPLFSSLICNDIKLQDEFNNRNKCYIF